MQDTFYVYSYGLLNCVSSNEISAKKYADENNLMANGVSGKENGPNRIG